MKKRRCIGLFAALMLTVTGFSVPAAAAGEADVFPAWNVASDRQVETGTMRQDGPVTQ